LYFALSNPSIGQESILFSAKRDIITHEAIITCLSAQAIFCSGDKLLKNPFIISSYHFRFSLVAPVELHIFSRYASTNSSHTFSTLAKTSKLEASTTCA
jgi:hypothetical protein